MMKITTQLSPNMENVVGTDVKMNKEIVGKIITYDKETGTSTIEVTSKEWGEKIVNKMQSTTVGVSSRGTSNEEINWNIVGDNRTRIKFVIPIDDTKKWWQFWK